MLGWETIRTVVRHDLEDPQNPKTVVELISDNLQRQQLDDLAIARCYRELKRLGVNCERKSSDTRDQLADHINCGKSGRSLDRLERLLQLPRDIQDLVSSKQLNKSHAEKILRLKETSQQAIFDALRRTDDVRDVLTRFKIITTKKKSTPRENAEELLKCLDRRLTILSEKIEDLDAVTIRGRDTVELLDAAIEFLTAWSSRKRRLCQQDIAEMQTRITGLVRPDKLSNSQR